MTKINLKNKYDIFFNKKQNTGDLAMLKHFRSESNHKKLKFGELGVF